jgi:hypothetical protein
LWRVKEERAEKGKVRAEEETERDGKEGGCGGMSEGGRKEDEKGGDAVGEKKWKKNRGKISKI